MAKEAMATERLWVDSVVEKDCKLVQSLVVGVGPAVANAAFFDLPMAGDTILGSHSAWLPQVSDPSGLWFRSVNEQ